jgi:hypothetical protein
VKEKRHFLYRSLNPTESSAATAPGPVLLAEDAAGGDWVGEKVCR